MKATILHNPRCSKSRAALALLREAGAEVSVVDYLTDPPSRAELARLLDRAGLSPREALRPEAKDVVPAEADDAAVLDAISADPRLIERPLVETEHGVRLCRPPERVRELLPFNQAVRPRLPVFRAGTVIRSEINERFSAARPLGTVGASRAGTRTAKRGSDART